MIALPEPHQSLPARMPGRAQAVAVVVCLVGVAPAVAWAAHAVLGLRLQPVAWTGATAWIQGAGAGFMAWAWVLALAPALEEFAMRPLLQTGLRHQLERIRTAGSGNSPDWLGHLANAGSALVFALLHLPANGVLALWWALPALAIGEVWRRSASWGLCTLLHAWFNTSLAVVTLLYSLP